MKPNSFVSATILAVFGASAHAQDAPLSAIDWLDQLTATPAAPPPEPATTRSGLAPKIDVVALDDNSVRLTGLVPATTTGLPEDLWEASDATDLTDALSALGVPNVRASQSLLYSLLLTESRPPVGDAMVFQLARLDALVALGALEPALALVESIGPQNGRPVLSRYFDLGILADNPRRACAIVQSLPRLSPGKGAEIYCAARAGQWDNAALLFGTADALGLLENAQAEALVRFLDPELFEGEPALPAPTEPDALMYTLLDSLGQRPRTTRWPRIYAHTDLSERSGWKSQLEAAERLAQTGALSPNRLLGIYTDRKAAASGGVWERVRAIQALDAAFDAQDVSAVSAQLPDAYASFRRVGLEGVLAVLYAERVENLTLSGAAADAAFELILLSGAYETAASVFPSRARRHPVLAAIASGKSSAAAQDPYAVAVTQAFEANATDLQRARLTGALGADILMALAQLEAGAAGDLSSLTNGLSRLRALGLEDTARRSALEILMSQAAK